MDLKHDELKQSILSLMKLQEIDGELFKLNSEAERPPESFQKLESELTSTQSALKLVERAYREAERERRGFELRVITMKQDLQKAEAKRREVRNTKEEFASNREADQLQKQAQEFEKVLGDKQALVDEKKALVDEKSKAVQELLEKFESEKKSRQERLTGLDSDKAELLKKREKHIGLVHDQLFQMYERVQKIRKGTGVALVKDGICQACYVAIPPHQKTKLIKLESLETCSSCSRILFPQQLMEKQESEESTSGDDSAPVAAQS